MKRRSRFALDRRTFLRGAIGGSLVALGLPTLDAMLDQHGEALANGDEIPRRMMTWLFGNGCRLEHWTPAEQGPDWTPTAELAPLDEVREYVSVLTGFKNPVAGRRGHHDGVAGIFSGYPFTKLNVQGVPYSSKFGGPSIDQVMADIIGTETYHRSLQVGVTKLHMTTQGPTLSELSHRGPDEPLTAVRDPQVLFDKLFAGFSTSADDGPEDVSRYAALDAVMSDAKRLKQRVGYTDGQRIDSHLESLYQLQKQILTLPPSCEIPTIPGVELVDPTGSEPLWEINEVMTELVRMAFTCDLTRVVSYMFTGASGHTMFKQLTPDKFPDYPGETDISHSSHHETSHKNLGYEQHYIHLSVVETMKNLAHMIKVFRDTPEGGGNLLDHMAMLCASDVAEGWIHSEIDTPLLVVGHAGGRLKTGVGHYRSTTTESITDVSLAVMKAVAPDPDAITKVGGPLAGYDGTSTTPCAAIWA